MPSIGSNSYWDLLHFMEAMEGMEVLGEGLTGKSPYGFNPQLPALPPLLPSAAAASMS